MTTSFSFSIIIYLAQVPGYFSAAWCNEKLDRRRTIAIYLVGSAISAFLLSQSDTSFTIVASGALLSFFLNGVYAGLYAYTPDSKPLPVVEWKATAALPEPTPGPAVMESHGVEDSESPLERKLRRAWEIVSGKP